MITGGRIDTVGATRKFDGPISGLNINISLDDVKVEGTDVTVNYTYTVNYEDNVGELKMIGVMFAREDAATAREIQAGWNVPHDEKGAKPAAKKAARKLPDSFVEMVFNTINFTCGSNGALVVRPVNLAPPMVPPRIEITKSSAKSV